MSKITVKFLTLFLLTSSISIKSEAQCVFTSADGYTVTVYVTPSGVIAPSSCPFGYNYNLSVNYLVSFSGTNIPANLYTLQGNIYCGTTVHFFSLPLTGGSGTVTTVSNPYRTTPDCTTATIASLGCNTSQITIQGPGLPAQTSTCAAGGPLSITLTSFKANLMDNNNVYLSWETANESENAFFVIERSSDATNWQSIKTIAGADYSNSPLQYHYVDRELKPGVYYYRLKQINTSGSVSYFHIVSVKLVSLGNPADIYVTQSLGNRSQVSIGGIADFANWGAEVFNSTGLLVFSVPSLSSATIHLPETGTGIYLMVLQNKVNGAIKTIKFLRD